MLVLRSRFVLILQHLQNSYFLDPSTSQRFQDVPGSSDGNQQTTDINEELMSLRVNKVWRFVPSNVTPLKSKWISRVEENANGKPVNHTAGVVVKAVDAGKVGNHPHSIGGSVL